MTSNILLISIRRSNCYMVWGGEFGSSTQQRFSQEDLVIGCLVDLATGLLNFTANGKEINTFYQASAGHLFKGASGPQKFSF